jgi:small subunit ribosomal protein S17
MAEKKSKKDETTDPEVAAEATEVEAAAEAETTDDAAEQEPEANAETETGAAEAEEADADDEPATDEVAAEAADEEPEATADETPSEPDEPVAEEAPAVEEPAAEAEEATADEPAEETPAAAAPAPAVEPKRKKKRLPRSLRRARPKRTRAAGGERKPIVRLPKPETERGRRQERQGVVSSDAMDKTIVVKVEMVKAHPRYKKVVRRSVKFHAHDEQNQAKVGDIVRIVETRPLSATKRWRLVEIIEAAK